MTNYDSYTTPPRPDGEVKRLVRTSDDKMIAGVCGGIARYLGVDATLIRVLMVVAVLFGAGCGLLLYAAGWVLMPKA